MLLDWLIRDLRVAARVLARDRAFSLTAASTLAVCIGANVTLFAIVDHVLLRPLPYDHAGQLVMVWSNNTHEGRDRNPLAPADVIDFKRDTQSFVDLQPMLSFLTADQYIDGPAPDQIRSSTVGAGMSSISVIPSLR